MKNEAVWTKKLVQHKSYGKWVQFYDKLPTDGFIFRTWRDFYSVRIKNILAVWKCIRLCVNFHVGTFRAHIRLLAKFKFPARTPNERHLNKACATIFLKSQVISNRNRIRKQRL